MSGRVARYCRGCVALGVLLVVLVVLAAGVVRAAVAAAPLAAALVDGLAATEDEAALVSAASALAGSGDSVTPLLVAGRDAEHTRNAQDHGCL